MDKTIRSLGGVMERLKVGGLLIKKDKAYYVEYNGEKLHVDGRVGWSLIKRRPDLVTLCEKNSEMEIYIATKGGLE
jgi:hypothetical protein